MASKSKTSSSKKVAEPEGRYFVANIRDELLKARASAPVVPGAAHTGELISGGKARAEDKKNFAQALSDGLAIKFADGLRPDFPGILPEWDAAGGVVKGNESPVRTLKGFKKLDVNFSTVQLGLGLGVSIKTLNFRDEKSKRYTKNVTRIDNELRAEAGDYHERQPFSVLVAVVFLPIDAAADGDVSSFAHAAQTYRFRTGRTSHRDGVELFERLYIALYEPTDEAHLGEVVCFDASLPPPRNGLPKPADRLTLDDVLRGIKAEFYKRNLPKKIFDESPDDADKTAELETLKKQDPELFNADDDDVSE